MEEIISISLQGIFLYMVRAVSCYESMRLCTTTPVSFSREKGRYRTSNMQIHPFGQSILYIIQKSKQT